MLRPLYERLDQTDNKLQKILENSNLQYLRNNNFIYTLTHITKNAKYSVKFYCPDYPYEEAQRGIIDSDDFYGSEELFELSKFLPSNPIIIDIGANIGSHSLYWGLICKAQKIHAFEPALVTYEILQKNIKLNHLEDIIIPHCKGVGEKSGKGDFAYHDLKASDSTVIKASDKGTIEIVALDDIQLDIDRIDLLKIDAEGMEYEVLKGCIEAIQKYNPMISLEIFGEEEAISPWFDDKYGLREALFKIPPKENYDNIVYFLKQLNYQIFTQTDSKNYIFTHKDKINNY